ncbi:MAG TPA: HDIG domain-containing protein [Firmicutes bacterium]|nr:HDIG domain-containing protein [Bacillota bacterium]
MKTELPRNYTLVSQKARKAMIFIGACFGIFLILLFMVTPQRVALKEGQVCPKGIKAPFDILDTELTEQLKEQAAASVKEVYDSDPQVAVEIGLNINRAFQKIKEAKSTHGSKGVPVSENVQNLKAELNDAVSEDLLRTALSMSDSELDACQKTTAEVAGRVLEGGITPDSLSSRKAQVDVEVSATKLTSGQKALVAALAKAYLKPNLFLNMAETQRRREEAVAAVEPVRILKRQWIVQEGEVVTARHLKLLAAAGLLAEGANLRPAVASALFAAALVVVLVESVRFVDKRVYASEQKLLVLVAIILPTLALSALLSKLSVYLSPVPAAALLIANLVDKRIGMMVGVVLSCSMGFANGGEMSYAIIGSLASIFGVTSIVRMGHRYDLIKAGLKIAILNAVVVTALAIAGGELLEWGLLFKAASAAGGGLFCAFLVLGIMPFLEMTFGVITPLRLLELANPNHPLLLKLLHDAPGTYHHSIMVANLAESATEAIGGNSLLARVGAYYHDVGKIKRPYFFIENQIGGLENPHEKISPSLSKTIITAHVKDGVEMAREYRLPPDVVDFIREHHGTTVVTYFYNKAAESEKQDEPVMETDFRYEGPKPHSKETALVMLADSVEAAVRSLTRPTPQRLEAIVKKIFDERLRDHQLDECELNLRELGVASSMFIKILTGMFHPRVEYPSGSRS